MAKITKNTRVTAEARIIGVNLRYMREAAGLSQHEIACFLDVSYQQVQKYESGQNRFPIEKLFHIKNFYDVPYEIFFRGMLEKSTSDNKPVKNHRAAIYARLACMQDNALRQKIEKIILILLN